MGKGNNQKGNKEAKKPKKEQTKVSATANSMAGKDKVTLGSKSK